VKGKHFKQLFSFFKMPTTLVFPMIPINKKFETGLETLGQVLSSGLYWIGA
jgi:hypothetical protein